MLVLIVFCCFALNKSEAQNPSIDLIGRAHLFHGWNQGLVLPIGGTGFLKYTQEYSRPWKKSVKHQERKGRLLAKRSAKLTFPWTEKASPTELQLRVHGLVSGQKITIRVNNKIVANKSVPNGWSVLKIKLPNTLVTPGENSLQLLLAKSGTAAGKKSYGLFHSIEIGSNLLEEAWPGLEVLSGKQSSQEKSIGGFEKLETYIEMPAQGVLETTFVKAGDESASIYVIDEANKRVSLWSSTSGSNGVKADLSALEGRLVRLVFEGAKGHRFSEPKITLPEQKRRAFRKTDNLILLVVDALRSDRLSFYDDVYGKENTVRTPNMDAYAQKGSLVFLNNQAASPSSPPSHGSIQTGMIPRVHGVDGDKGQLKQGVPTISTQVVKKGISAGYYGNNPFGMGRHEIHGRWTEFHQPGKEGKSNDCTTLMGMMLDFASKQNKKGKRFFISSLPYETHTPYRYHEGFSDKYFKGPWGSPVGKNVDGNLLSALSGGKVKLNPKQWKQLKALYNGEAEHMDKCFGQLVDGLKSNGLLANTAIVLTSDHGEGMFEHKKMGHAFGHYRELGDVPFVVFAPGLLEAGITKKEMVTSHHDLVPTMLDMMEVNKSKKIQGVSVLNEMLSATKGPPRVVSLEYGRSYSLRSKSYKMIVDYQGKTSYFDLQNDPWETSDSRRKKPMAARYLTDIAGYFLKYRSVWQGEKHGSLNAPHREFQSLL